MPSKDKAPAPTRRDFLRLATTGLLGVAGSLGVAGLIRYLGFDSEPPVRTVIDVGAASDFPPGSHTILPALPAALFSTPTGFRALSLVCTHLGCTVEETEGGFKCPCHGSRFDAQGNLQRGPARQGLHALRVETTPEGRVLIHTGQG